MRDKADSLYRDLSRQTGFAALAKEADFKTDERAFRIGADGEEHVGKLLAGLEPQGFRVLHSIPVGRGSGDIDHVVIGPPGVFTINTKRHPQAKVLVDRDKVLVNGRSEDYLQRARNEARRAALVLGKKLNWRPNVVGVVVLAGADTKVIIKAAPPPGVKILHANALTGWLSHQNPVLGEQRIDSIYAWSRRSTTWR